jgi:hypothetical protein
MIIDELEAKYLNVLQTLKKQGTKNKILVMLLLIPAGIYAYFDLTNNNNGYQERDQISQGMLIVICIGVVIFWIFIILMSKSITFINNKSLRYFNNSFKKELFDCLKNDITELQEYIYYSKIKPAVFYASGLFNSRYDDYLGDDWMRGTYKGVVFDLCELHVSRLFKPIFNGIFVKCDYRALQESEKFFSILDNPLFKDFENRYCAAIHSSANHSCIYIAVDMKGYFFENKNRSSIEKLDMDSAMLKDLIALIKTD